MRGAGDGIIEAKYQPIFHRLHHPSGAVPADLHELGCEVIAVEGVAKARRHRHRKAAEGR
jgi:hypothetical protein